MFVHNYYAQPIYSTDVSKWCESLIDWSIPLKGLYIGIPIIPISHVSIFKLGQLFVQFPRLTQERLVKSIAINL